MDKSEYIEKAKKLLEEIKGRPLPIQERQEKAILLASWILLESKKIQTNSEKYIQEQLSRMMKDPQGKAFAAIFTDQCFRSDDPRRVADQVIYILKKLGVPAFLPFSKRMGLYIFKYFGKLFPSLFVSLTKSMIRREASRVILSGEPKELAKHIRKRQQEGVRVNLNHLGEAVLGENEAKKRLQLYIEDLKKPEVDYISVKISTICSQLNLLAWDQTLDILAERLRTLFRAAADKFVNLDMEEYRDLHLTVALFKKVLSEPEFLSYSAGIVLQSYLPDSYIIQQELTQWALNRFDEGGAPIKIRIVKGANLAMEKVEASIRGWSQAPYTRKSEVDANYKRMLHYGCIQNHAQAVNLGVASHNLFDISYALLLVSENEIQPFVSFEMLEGMADNIRRVVQMISGEMLLYCPAATKEEFQNAVAYLIRRLDENTASENFLRHAFDLSPGTPEWNNQVQFFKNACEESSQVFYQPRRKQNRLLPTAELSGCRRCRFENEPDTDWSLEQNREWGREILRNWSGKAYNPIQNGPSFAKHQDPSKPSSLLYKYTLADAESADRAVVVATEVERLSWQARSHLLAQIAHHLRQSRADLIGAMVADTAKTVAEADVEVSEAIDFAEYYRHNMEELHTMQDVSWQPKGVILVAPPWNFPCSIPAGGILSALAGGNSVIFKPAPEAVLVGWTLVNILWEAGVPKDLLQFITCDDETVGSQLVKDQRIHSVILTGATSTAKLFLKIRPGLDLIAETGGKNSIIVTELADRDLAIKDIVQSAFGHAGQKCSACSLLILEAGVYDDPHFLAQLKDATKSLKVGSPWDPQTKVNPLIREPNPTLLRGLTRLEEGEEWLCQPRQDSINPQLWSPGIKLGVKAGGFTHQNELFGPVLGVMRARDLRHAVELANGTPYGLTGGIHSLDEREQSYWMNHIEIGNGYINRGITGAIVQRQPFGGCKQSSFGKGVKAGGPNYLMQMMVPMQIKNPQEIDVIGEGLKKLLNDAVKVLSEAEMERLRTAFGSYAFYWNNYFSKDHDPSQLLGQDNILSYKPHINMFLRLQETDSLFDQFAAVGAAITCGCPIVVSGEKQILTGIAFIQETEEQFIERIAGLQVRVRLLSKPSHNLQKALAEYGLSVLPDTVVLNGRIELLNYLREAIFSVDYHRYGNLGLRENTPRTPSRQCHKNPEQWSAEACLGQFKTNPELAKRRQSSCASLRD